MSKQKKSADKDIRKFLRACDQRLTAAECLLENGIHLDAIYLAGYAVECGLKALILKRTPQNKYAAIWKKLTAVGAKGHDFEYLKQLVKQRSQIESRVAESLSRVATWSTDLRYEVGYVPFRDAEAFLKAAKEIRDWCASN